MSPWIWKIGKVIRVEQLPDGTARLIQLEPSPSELEREAQLRDDQVTRSRGWLLSGGNHGSQRDARRRWRKTVLEHEVERRAQREGKGGRDE